MKASLMRPIPPGSTRSVSTGSSATYTNAALPVEITEERIRLSDDSNDYVTHTHAFLRRVYVVYIYIYIYICRRCRDIEPFFWKISQYLGSG